VNVPRLVRTSHDVVSHQLHTLSVSWGGRSSLLEHVYLNRPPLKPLVLLTSISPLITLFVCSNTAIKPASTTHTGTPLAKPATT
jgi:hypothetical protein